MKSIHVISFDVPYPYDYGGVIDVYHRCKALKESGYYVHLHCFEYGRGERKELLDVADVVDYYKRKNSLKSLLSFSPFIVKSRSSQELLNTLIKDKAPILFEGQHTTALLNHKALKNRIKLIRSHNVEHDYYRQLAKVEKNWFKRLFFKIEAYKLKQHERYFTEADKNFTVSHKDQDYFQVRYKNAYFLPVANPLSWSNKQRDTQPYILMHGNLSVKENEHAVLWALENINKDYNIPFVIAGKNPPKTLTIKIQSYPNTVLHNTPSNEKLNTLIRNAGVNLLITFQSTGIKHKLINALCNGGHVLANTTMIKGTGLAHLCTVKDNKEEITKTLASLIAQPMNEADIEQRNSEIKRIYGLARHAEQIHQIIEEIKQSQ
ncbi:MAG: hypothetical protein ACPGU5_08235 [Lishizhenia sp.]